MKHAVVSAVVVASLMGCATSSQPLPASSIASIQAIVTVAIAADTTTITLLKAKGNVALETKAEAILTSLIAAQSALTSAVNAPNPSALEEILSTASATILTFTAFESSANASG